MSSSFKQNKTMRAGMVLLVIMLITCVGLYFGYAKYTSQGSGSDDARVAKWGIGITTNTDLDLFDDSYKHGGQTVVDSSGDPKPNVVAPGTSKEAEVLLVNVTGNAPEVMYDFDINVKVTDGTSDPKLSTVAELDELGAWNWYYYFDNDTTHRVCATHGELETKINDLSQKGVAPNTLPAWMQNGARRIYIGWVWSFDDNSKGTWDKEDTRLGNLIADGKLDNLKVEFSTKATQVQGKKADQVTVAFDTNGGSKNPDSLTFDKGGKATKPAVDPTKDGYEFVAWCDENGNEWSFDTAVNKSMILFASWNKVAPTEITPPTLHDLDFTYELDADGKPIVRNIDDSQYWDNYDSNQVQIGGTYSASDAGTYTVTMTPKDGFVWTGGGTDTKSYTWTIKKADASFIGVPEDQELTFGGVTVVNYGFIGDGTVSVVSSDTDIVKVGHEPLDQSISLSTNTKLGQATITLSATEGKNYKAPTDATFDVKVNAAKLEVTAPDVDEQYDGAKHYIYAGTNNVTDVLFKYGTTEGALDKQVSTGATTSALFTELAQQEPTDNAITVYYEASKAGYNTVNGSATINISKRVVQVAWNEPFTKTWDGSAIGIGATLNEVSGTPCTPTIEVKKDGEVVTTYTDAGTYHANVTGISDTIHYVLTGEPAQDYTINKAASVIETFPEAVSTTYNKSEQDLAKAGTATGGELMYWASESQAEVPPTDKGEWSSTVPKAKDANTYYVWYKVFGDGNHTDTDPVRLTGSVIAKGTRTATLSPGSLSLVAAIDDEPGRETITTGFTDSEAADEGDECVYSLTSTLDSKKVVSIENAETYTADVEALGGGENSIKVEVNNDNWTTTPATINVSVGYFKYETTTTAQLAKCNDNKDFQALEGEDSEQNDNDAVNNNDDEAVDDNADNNGFDLFKTIGSWFENKNDATDENFNSDENSSIQVDNPVVTDEVPDEPVDVPANSAAETLDSVPNNIDENDTVASAVEYCGLETQTNLTIPSTIKYNNTNINVAGVGTAGATSQAAGTIFKGDTYVENLSLNPNVKTICPYAFAGVSTSNPGKIKTVKSTTYLTTIGNRSFAYCTNLTQFGSETNQITLSSTLANLDEYAFSNCNNSSLDKLSYSAKAGMPNYCFYNSHLNSVTISASSGVTSIPHYAFYGIEALKNKDDAVYDTNGYYLIGAGTSFNKDRVAIKSTVKVIADYAFNSKSTLRYVLLGSNFGTYGTISTHVGTCAFANCANLNTFVAKTKDTDTTQYDKITYGLNPFANSGSINTTTRNKPQFTVAGGESTKAAGITRGGKQYTFAAMSTGVKSGGALADNTYYYICDGVTDASRTLESGKYFSVPSGRNCAWDFNGQDVIATNCTSNGAFVVTGGTTSSTLRLDDSSGTSTATTGGGVTNCKNTATNDNLGAINVQGTNGYIYFANGRIHNNTCKQGGAFGIGAGARLYTYGGYLCNNSATDGSYGGGAIMVKSSGYLYMYGGTIYNNSATNHGGAIWVNGEEGTGYMYFYAGTIDKNTAKQGGAIMAGDGSSIFIGSSSYSDIPKITNNTSNASTYGGGGIMIKNSGKVTMYKGEISGNWANNKGGGVYNNGASASFTMTGGSIVGNYKDNPRKQGGFYGNKTGITGGTVDIYEQ